jgi:hypothetical protein
VKLAAFPILGARVRALEPWSSDLSPTTKIVIPSEAGPRLFFQLRSGEVVGLRSRGTSLRFLPFPSTSPLQIRARNDRNPSLNDS